MKIKDLGIKNSELCHNIRFNSKTSGVCVNKGKGSVSDIKRDIASCSIFSLMSECGFYRENGSISDTVKLMLDNSKEYISNQGGKSL